MVGTTLAEIVFQNDCHYPGTSITPGWPPSIKTVTLGPEFSNTPVI